MSPDAACREPIADPVRQNEMTRYSVRAAAMLLLYVLTASSMLVSTPANAGPRRYSLPIPGASMVRDFDLPEQRWKPGHRGVDLGAAAGSPVHAAADGNVNHVGVVAGRPVLSIRHRDGLLTTYEPVRASVRRGQRVRRGDVIGTLEAGHPGCSPACLHWGARRGSGHDAVYLDPRALLGAVRVRLKPLDD